VRVAPPPTAVTVTVYAPADVAGDVDTFKVEVHVGLHEATLKDALAPEGKPEAEKFTDCAGPVVREAVTVVNADSPGEIAAALGFRASENANPDG